MEKQKLVNKKGKVLGTRKMMPRIDKQCYQHRFVDSLITHGNISHPAGIQCCVYCGKIFDELVEEIKAQEKKKSIKLVKNHLNTSTYEQHEALVFRTTVMEILALLK